MVGGDAVDGAIEQRLAQGLSIALFAQRRVDAEEAIVGAQLVIGHQQVMRGYLGGERNILLFCPLQ